MNLSWCVIFFVMLFRYFLQTTNYLLAWYFSQTEAFIINFNYVLGHLLVGNAKLYTILETQHFIQKWKHKTLNNSMTF